MSGPDVNAGLIVFPLGEWFARIFPDDRARIAKFVDAKQVVLKRDGQVDRQPHGRTLENPWWNEYHGKAAEVALCRVFGRTPSFETKRDPGFDVTLAPGMTADAKFTWQMASPWLYLGGARYGKESNAYLLVLVTRYSAATDRDYLLCGWIKNAEFKCTRGPTPFYSTGGNGLVRYDLSSMDELDRAVQERRREG